MSEEETDSDLQKTDEGIRMLVMRDTAEYIERNGYVTVEFASSPARLEVLRPLLAEFSGKLKEAGMNARWIVYECSTCRGYHTEFPLHVSIEKYDFFSFNGEKHLVDVKPDDVLLGGA